MSCKRWGTTAAVIALAVGLTACGGGDDDDPETNGDPTTAETSEPSPSTPTPTTPAATGPLAGYTEEEVDAYRDAVAVWEELGRIETRLMAAGKATPSARQQLLSVFVRGAEQDDWETLQDLEAAGARIEGRARTVWIKPVRVLLDPESEAGTVDLRTCVNATSLRVITSNDESGVGSRYVATATVDFVPSDNAWRVADTSREGKC